MVAPAVTLTTLDGALGVLPPGIGKALAIIGPSSSGTAGVVAAYARARDVYTAFGYGPMPEAACLAIERYGRPVVCCKAAATTAGTVGTIDVTGKTGACVVAVDTDPAAVPFDDYDVWVKIITGGTVGVAGITYKESLDGGLNWSGLKSLGTASELTVAAAGTTINFTLTAAALVANDVWKLRCNAPVCQSSDLTAPLLALKQSGLEWEALYLASPIDATIAGVLDASMASMASLGKYHWWIGNSVLPTATDTETTYLASQTTAAAAYSTTYGNVWGGSAWVVSSMPGTGRANTYRAPVARALAPKLLSVSEEVDIAQLDAPGGAIPGVLLADTNGNPVHHDELINPGLDDIRLATLKTWPGYAGPYVTNPRIKSADGSDFEFVQHRRVFCLFQDTLYRYFVRRLSKSVRVNTSTGYILEADAIEIEKGAYRACADVLLQKPKASGLSITLSRTDNLLSTKTMTVDARMIPLAYPKAINVTVGFVNPALRIVKV